MERRGAAAAFPVVDRKESRAVSLQVVVTGDPCPDLPPETPLRLDIDQKEPRLAVWDEGDGEVRRHGDGGAVQIGRPHDNIVVALVAGGERRGGGDPLSLVGCKGVELVVVYADAVVEVAGVERDLHDGGEEVGACGEVELEDGGVLEVELGLGGAEDEPDDEDDDEDNDDEGEDGSEEASVQLAPLAVSMVATVLRRHDKRMMNKKKKKKKKQVERSQKCEDI